MVQESTQALSYRDAGVDIDAGDALVERIKPFARKTLRDGVLSGLGGFGALFEVPKRYREPVLVSGTDGVGTKLKLAVELNRHDTVGIDLVAMSVNDVLAQGVALAFFFAACITHFGKFNQMPAKLGFNRLADLPHFQTLNRVFKFRHHHAIAKPT